MPSSAAQLKRALNVGAEAWFDQAHERYARDGKAKMVRCHFPVSGAPGRMRPLGKGDADFAGVAQVWPSVLSVVESVAVAFDLKVHKRGDYSLDVLDKPEVLRQVQGLRDFNRCGGIGFLALLDPDAGELWLLGEPWLARLEATHRVVYRAKQRNGPWQGVPFSATAPPAVMVREADTATLARTGIRFDWHAALVHVPTT